MRRILLEEWDPIGIRNEPVAADDYDEYIGPVFDMLERNAPALEVVEYLRGIEVVRMGLGKPRWLSEHSEKTVSALQALWTRSVTLS